MKEKKRILMVSTTGMDSITHMFPFPIIIIFPNTRSPAQAISGALVSVIGTVRIRRTKVKIRYGDTEAYGQKITRRVFELISIYDVPWVHSRTHIVIMCQFGCPAFVFIL